MPFLPIELASMSLLSNTTFKVCAGDRAAFYARENRCFLQRPASGCSEHSTPSTTSATLVDSDGDDDLDLDVAASPGCVTDRVSQIGAGTSEGSTGTDVEEDDELNLFEIFKPLSGELEALFFQEIPEYFNVCADVAVVYEKSCLSNVADLLASSDFPIYRRAVTPVSTSSSTSLSRPNSASHSFNPNALEFIPSCVNDQPAYFYAQPWITHMLSEEPIPITPSSIAPPSLSPSSVVSQPEWFPLFWTATSPSPLELSPDSRAALFTSQARTLVNQFTWNTDSLAELAQHFVWKAASISVMDIARNIPRAEDEGLAAVREVARFVAEVCRAFTACKGGIASRLLWHLRECVMGSFTACWRTDQPHAISPACPPSPSYLASALSLAAFVGALTSVIDPSVGFDDRNGVAAFRDPSLMRPLPPWKAPGTLLPPKRAHDALATLLCSLGSMEHLQAVRLLVGEGRQFLWWSKHGNHAIKNFVTAFTQRSSALLGEPRGVRSLATGYKSLKTEVRMIVGEVVEVVHQWRRRTEEQLKNKDGQDNNGTVTRREVEFTPRQGNQDKLISQVIPNTTA